jgi:hypothetical protein
MAEGHRATLQAATWWTAEGGLGLHLRCSGLQPGPSAESSEAVSKGRLKRAVNGCQDN